MKFLSSKILLLVLPIISTTANLQCIAKPGDLISHTTTHSTVSTYTVTGWQNQLTGATPNLKNYYWTPMTKRIINTTQTTTRGATTAPTIIPDRTAHYVKPIHAQMPSVNHAQAVTAETSLRISNTIFTTSTATRLVLLYSNPSPATNVRTTSTALAAKESVCGVLVTPRQMRAKAQSL